MSILRGRPRASVWGGLALLGSALFVFGGPTGIFRFERLDPHRFTAMAMLTGTLRLRNGLAGLAQDEEVHNGATYTHWNYGAPLLQLPFQAASRALHPAAPFFPDRAIFFFYFVAMVLVLWAAMLRLFARWMPDVDASRRCLVCFSATWLVLSCTIFPVTSCRFDIFEETVAYLVVLELFALSAYLFTLLSDGKAPAAWLGVAAGLGLLIRPTGILFAGVWGLCLALQGREKKTAAFAFALTPFVGAWLFFNWARSGSLLQLGFANSNPKSEFHNAMQRFGSACVDTTWHTLEVAGRLFEGLFFYDSSHPLPWMSACHFDFAQRGVGHEPLFGPLAPLVLAFLVYTLYRYLVARERRLAVYVPYAAMVLLFFSYVRAGAGFAWRYMEDFYPLIVLVGLEYLRTRPPPRRPLVLAGVLFALGSVLFVRYVEPWKLPSSKTETLSDEQAASLWPRFEEQRWGVDAPLAPRLACPDPDASFTPYQQREGWRPSCAVGTFTNVYLGVPRKSTGDYRIRLETADMAAPDALRLYVNGLYYTARRHGDAYEADVQVPYAELTSPTVMTTIEWTHGIVPPSGRLLSIEIL